MGMRGTGGRTKKHLLRVAPEHEGRRLDHVLADWLPVVLGQTISRAKVRKLIVAGAVYLNGQRTRIASKTLRTGARVEAYVDLDRLMDDERSRDAAFELIEDRVLFEDESLLVVNKPPGLPTQPTVDEFRDSLFAAAKRYLQKRYGGAPYVALHHRLDRDTSGVLLLVKDEKVNRAIAGQFTRHEIEKTYQALTVRPERVPPMNLPGWPEWTVRNYLGAVEKNGRHGKRRVFGAVRAGGDVAETHFRLVEDLGGGLWVEARPKTGRTHQIRVHLSELGLPILGDDLYGAGAGAVAGTGAGAGAGASAAAGMGVGGRGEVPRLMLHASLLRFIHPISGVAMSVEAPLPEDFRQVRDGLRASGG